MLLTITALDAPARKHSKIIMQNCHITIEDIFAEDIALLNGVNMKRVTVKFVPKLLIVTKRIVAGTSLRCC